ncbi:MAG: hypothetical protein CSA07_03675 [Bacteroidia bacterium]|nr:MAG: hypothetical protein CSA07_03675 [Bacteroidia bacterium]
MKNALFFISPVLETTESPIDTQLLNEARDLYEEGKYLEALHRFIDHLNPAFRQKYEVEPGVHFAIPHNTMVVNIKVRDEHLHVWVDYMRVPAEGRVAVLRQLAMLASNKFILARVLLDEEDCVRIEYDCPMDTTHPEKLLSLLGNICQVGEQFQATFAHDFDAQPIVEPQIRPYPEELVQRIYRDFQRTGRKAIEDTEQSLKDGNTAEADMQASMGFSQLLYFANPKGYLYAECWRCLRALDEEIPVRERVQRGVKDLQRMLDMPVEEFAKSLYYSETLLSDNNVPTLRQFGEVYEDKVDRAQKFGMDKKDWPFAVTLLTWMFYQTYSLNDMPRFIDAFIRRALEEASGLPVKEAAEILFRAARQVQKGKIEDAPAGGAGRADSAEDEEDAEDDEFLLDLDFSDELTRQVVNARLDELLENLEQGTQLQDAEGLDEILAFISFVRKTRSSLDEYLEQEDYESANRTHTFLMRSITNFIDTKLDDLIEEMEDDQGDED